MNKKAKVLVTSLAAIAMSASLMTGATYALFTSESKLNIAINSANVELQANIENKKLYSVEASATGEITDEYGNTYTHKEQSGDYFSMGGSAIFSGGELAIENILPGDKVTFDVVGTNKSSVTVKYRYSIACSEGEAFMHGLSVTVNGESYTSLKSYQSAWTELAPNTNMATVSMAVEMPVTTGSEFADKGAKILVTVEAVQGNAATSDEGAGAKILWNGEADDEALGENTDTVAKALEIENGSQLAAFAEAVNAGNTYKGYTVKLTNNIDLAGINWTPIGPNADAANKFQGTFDGQGYVISNLTVQQGEGYHAAGLFGALNGTVKNLVIENANISSISGGAGTDNGNAVLAGSIYTSGSVDNVTVRNSSVTANRYIGAIAGYAYGNITNCTVENVTLKGFMNEVGGVLDNGDKIGGIVGYAALESTYKLSGNKVIGCTLEGARDLGGIGGVVAYGGNAEFENNYVANTYISFFLDKNYAEAGEIVSGRLGIVPPASNTFVNVTIEDKSV